MQDRKPTKLQKLISHSAALEAIIAHLQGVFGKHGADGFNLMMNLPCKIDPASKVGFKYVDFKFLEANAKRILQQFHQGVKNEEAWEAFVEIAEVFNSDPRFIKMMQRYHAGQPEHSEKMRNFLLAEASCCILETCMTIINKPLFVKWRALQESAAGAHQKTELTHLKKLMDDNILLLANVRQDVAGYRHPDQRPKQKKVSLTTKKINLMKMDVTQQELLASLIQRNPECSFFDAVDYETGMPVKYLVPDPSKSGVYHHVKLSHSLVRYQRKKSQEHRFAICHSAPLGEGTFGVVYESSASLAIQPGTKGKPNRAIVKKKKIEKTRVVKHIKKTYYDADKVKREGEMLEKVMLLHAKHPVISEENCRGSIVMRKFNGKELIDHLIADWGDDCDVITKNTFTVDQRIALTIMVGEAIINQVHESGLIHRDIKGDNIMVELDKHNNPLSAVVIDYGLAKYKGEKTTENVGTSDPVDYRAPEVIAKYNPSSDEKSDAYSFATLLNEIVWFDVIYGSRYNDLTRDHKNAINEIMRLGIRTKVHDRVSMQEIVNLFREIQRDRVPRPQSLLVNKNSCL